jgi:hypothetical protein
VKALGSRTEPRLSSSICHHRRIHQPVKTREIEVNPLQIERVADSCCRSCPCCGLPTPLLSRPYSPQSPHRGSNVCPPVVVVGNSVNIALEINRSWDLFEVVRKAIKHGEEINNRGGIFFGPPWLVESRQDVKQPHDVTHLHQIRAGDAIDIGDRDGKEHVAPPFDRLGASVEMSGAVDISRLSDRRRIAAQSYLVYRNLRGMELELNRDCLATPSVTVPSNGGCSDTVWTC